jgi:hypothetical protein
MGILKQIRLKELLHYNQTTGAFIRLVARGNGTVGTVAGAQNRRGYIRILIDGHMYRAHRLAFLYMDGEFPDAEVDHINQNRSDNSWANLRSVTRQENGKNQKLHANNTSGTMGVYWRKDSEKWVAEIHVDGDRFHLGTFSLKTKAIDARKAAQNKHGFHRNHGAPIGAM